MRRKIILPAALGISLIGGILFAAIPVGAQNLSPGTQTIVQRIAKRFNLNQTDVQKVFDDVKQEKHQQMMTTLEQRLTQAVTDGKINEAQKQAIITKLQDLQNNRPDPSEFKNLTPDQRKAKMEEKKTEMETWATQNGIGLQTLRELIGPRGHGFRMMHKMGGN